jgi:hypothetical protein
MLDVHLAHFEIKHFHQLFQFLVAGFKQFLSLLIPELNHLIRACE